MDQSPSRQADGRQIEEIFPPLKHLKSIARFKMKFNQGRC